MDLRGIKMKNIIYATSSNPLCEIHQNIEAWTYLPNSNELYLVSNKGRIKSLPRKFVKKEKLIIGRLDKDGYRLTELSTGFIRYHHAVLFSFVGPKPENMQCRHLDGIRDHNCLENICWGTSLEDSQDRKIHGTLPRGEKVNTASLTESQVLAIRKDMDEIIIPGKKLGNGIMKALMEKHNVKNYQVMYHIYHRKTWGWLQ